MVSGKLVIVRWNALNRVLCSLTVNDHLLLPAHTICTSYNTRQQQVYLPAFRCRIEEILIQSFTSTVIAISTIINVMLTLLAIMRVTALISGPFRCV